MKLSAPIRGLVVQSCLKIVLPRLSSFTPVTYVSYSVLCVTMVSVPVNNVQFQGLRTSIIMSIPKKTDEKKFEDRVISPLRVASKNINKIAHRRNKIIRNKIIQKHQFGSCKTFEARDAILVLRILFENRIMETQSTHLAYIGVDK